MPKGIKTVVRGFNKLVKKIRARADAHAEGFEEGLVKAAYFLLRESMAVVPVEFGFLRNSANVFRFGGNGFRTRLQVSYYAEYALWVHERLDLAHGREYNQKWAEDIALGRKTARGVNQQAKFLEAPFRRNKELMISIIRRTMVERSQQEKGKD